MAKSIGLKQLLTRIIGEKHKPKEVIIVKAKSTIEPDALASIRDMISDLCSEISS